MALLWTLGPGLLFVPRGAYRLVVSREVAGSPPLLALSVLPALGSHLLVHFGVPGYAFHYVPALLALTALGIGRTSATSPDAWAPARLVALAAFLAAVFWFYPADFERPGVRGRFRPGLRPPDPDRPEDPPPASGPGLLADAQLATTPRTRCRREAGPRSTD